jgi:hypothetical protein
MIILLYLEIFIWVLAIYALVDVVGPLLLGKKPFAVIRSVFKKKEPKKDEPSGKSFRSNRANS